MRHRKKSKNFSRSRAQKKALFKALAKAVVVSERIVTTTPKAKQLRSKVDRLITWSKKDTLFYRRLAYRTLEDHKLVRRLFDVIGPRFKNIEGGYTRILKVGTRKGDGAPLSILELTKLGLVKTSAKKTKGAKEPKTIEAAEEKSTPKKEAKSKKGFVPNVRKIFKKEKDSL